EQLEFPVLYTNARTGTASRDPAHAGADLRPLFDAIVQHVPPPRGNLEAPLHETRVTKLYAFEGLKRVDIDQAAAGDIVCLAGIEEITIGETIADVEQRVPIP